MVRRRLDAKQSRDLILDAAERLMERCGYAAVNTRSVAIEACVKPPLVHYHFATTENLLLEAYRHSVSRSEALLRKALASERPLHAIWHHNSDPARTVLAVQFMALAQQHPSIREEMARNVERFRTIQAQALTPLIEARDYARSGVSPAIAAMLIAAIGRFFVMEEAIGIALGHQDFRQLIENLIDTLEPLFPGPSACQVRPPDSR